MNTEIDKLLEKFHSGEIPKYGALSVWNDFIGRPLDNIYELKRILFHKSSNIIEFLFQNDNIKVQNPRGINFSKNGITILKADRVERYTHHYSIIYTFDNGQIVTKNLKGVKPIHTTPSADAFAFVSW